MGIFTYLILAVYLVLGGGTTLFITAYMFIVLAQKIKNKIKTGASLYA